jgi:hypothetical protein
MTFQRSPSSIGLLAVLALVCFGSFSLLASHEASSAIPKAVPNATVVVELFTSEGCSSCPPADAVLSRLVQQQPLEGITVLGLGEHVDYWNDLGWVDPFSSASFSKRQQDYANSISHSRGAYTPQLVVDGKEEVIGSDEGEVHRAISRAAAVQKATMNIAADLPSSGDALQVQVAVTIPPEVTIAGASSVMIAVTEDNLASDVHRGENSGRHLKHTAVVRQLVTLGQLKPGLQQWSGSTSIAIAPQWTQADLKVIGFLQEQGRGDIVGGGWTNVSHPGGQAMSRATSENVPVLGR